MLLPLLVGVAIGIIKLPGFEMAGNLIGLMDTFDKSSLRGFDVRESGWIGELELIIAIRGGDEDAPMMGDKFDDWKWKVGKVLNLKNLGNLQSPGCRNRLETRWW